MPTVQQLNVPEELLHRILASDRPLELYELSYLSSVRPNPRDVADIHIVAVNVRAWARGLEHMLAIFKAAPIPSITIGAVDHELPVLAMISCAPEGGVSLESMLVTGGEQPADPREIVPPTAGRFGGQHEN